ncbi:MAG TPA: helix-hairpin-helix domain-containing protein [Bacteroidales bacterium]|nr:helix-hairpin-helix domain-containing protein [Bacteroidales bacterium]HRW86342.1 helix-hairpin-helix domain-containing protein [Bacteroidales bacterium]
MKSPFFEQIKGWFGFTRRERRSTFILLFIICVVAGLRFIVPPPEGTVEAVALEGFVNIQDTALRKEKVIRYSKVPSSPPALKPRPVIELNTCDSSMLEALPGLGPVLSSRIIRYRNLLGGYVSAEQLREVYGLSDETFNLISKRVTADTSLVRKIEVNTAGYRDIIRLPYFTREEVSAILKYRELMGKISGPDELVENKIITKEKAEKVRLYMVY